MRILKENKNKFGTHSERYTPNILAKEETTDTQEHKKVKLKAVYIMVDID